MVARNSVRANVGRRIRERREALGFSMEQVASKVGLRAWQAVQQWENGVSSPQRNRMNVLAEVLETTEDWINTGATASSMISDKDREMLDLIGYLTTDQQTDLKEQLLKMKQSNESMYRSLLAIGPKLG